MFEFGNMSTRHRTLSLDFIDALAEFVAVAAHDPLFRQSNLRIICPMSHRHCTARRCGTMRNA